MKILSAFLLIMCSLCTFADTELAQFSSRLPQSDKLDPAHAASLKARLLDDITLNNHSPIDQLRHYQKTLINLSQTEDWPSLPKTPLLRFGEEHSIIPQLRKRLMLLGDFKHVNSCDIADSLFGIELHDALVNFQKRHGLKADGIYGPSTRRELNITPAQRAETITLNIQRMMTFTPISDRYIQVNIPAFALELYEHGTPILSMKTIVGKRKRKTPIFETTINRIVVNPAWHVPKSIAYKDIVPALSEDPGYLEKLNLKLVTGWGDSMRELSQDQLNIESLYQGDQQQRFWEPPSSNGTLGSVKFLTSGPYAIYLHDTNAKNLFQNSTRAFSSGCIRVEKPRKLADELMRMTHGWRRDQLDEIFNSSKRRMISLPDSVPLYITYWTAFIDNNGVNFRADLYRRDKIDLAQLDNVNNPQDNN